MSETLSTSDVASFEASSASLETRTYHLKIWRQRSDRETGGFEEFTVPDILPDQSFLEMLDVLNDSLVAEGKEAIAFESDCREGICGACSLVIDGVPHGPVPGTTTCGLRMRIWKDGANITIEPFRAKSFPIIKDLVVDRTAFDRIIQKGGYVSVGTGSAPEANLTPIGKQNAELAFEAATCIGCGACVAACPNASASLFTGAKIAQYTYLPQGQVERAQRVQKMVDQMDEEGFGDCSNHAECEAACPKKISITNIAKMRKEYAKSLFS